MNIPFWSSIVTCTCMVIAVVLVLRHRHAASMGALTRWALVTSCAIYALVAVTNVLEHGGITDLFDPAEAAELTLHTIEVAVVVTVTGREGGVAPFIGDGYAFDAVNRERQPGDPRATGEFIGQIELRGGGVLDQGFCAEIVY